MGAGKWSLDSGPREMTAVNRQPEETGATAPQLGKFMGKLQNTVSIVFSRTL